MPQVEQETSSELENDSDKEFEDCLATILIINIIVLTQKDDIARTVSRLALSLTFSADSLLSIYCIRVC